jgi:hypothetical protein
MRDFFEEMLEPTDKLTLASRVLTAVWLAVVLVELAVWLVICVISGDLQSPWWLWSVLVGGIIVGGFHLAIRGRKGAR